jgi:predicted dehydrogenase
MPRARGPAVVLYGAGTVSMAHGASAGMNAMPIAAVASRSPARAAARAAELGSRPATFADVLERRVRADIAIVCTPPHRHAVDAVALLDAGYAVLVETPLCATLADADALVAAAAHHHGRLQYGEHLAHAPVVQAMVPLAGGIGPLTHVEARALQGPPPDDDPRRTPSWGGGVLFDLGLHPLSLVLLLANAAGAGMPVEVRCTLQARDEVDVRAEVRVRHASGLSARVEASWSDSAVQWDAQCASATGVVRAELLPHPQLEWNGDAVALPTSTSTSPVRQLEDYGYVGELRSFAADLARAATPVIGAPFGRLVLDVICAAYRSAGRDGAPEVLPFTGDRNRTPFELWRGA